jgi:hypothetical protein
MFSIGSGESVSFWLDQWCEEGVLKGLFPAIYSIAQDKQAKVQIIYHGTMMTWFGR